MLDELYELVVKRDDNKPEKASRSFENKVFVNVDMIERFTVDSVKVSGLPKARIDKSKFKDDDYVYVVDVLLTGTTYEKRYVFAGKEEMDINTFLKKIMSTGKFIY